MAPPAVAAPEATDTPVPTIVGPRPPAPPSPPDRSAPWWRRPLGIAGVVILLAGTAAGALLGTGVLSSSPARGSVGRRLAVLASRHRKPVGSTARPSTTPGVSTSPSTTSTPHTTPIAKPAAQLGPAAVIRQHLHDLNYGLYRQAFRLMAPSYRSANPSWPSVRAAADPGITIVSIGTAQYGSGTAQVPVSFYARDRNQVTGSDTKCRHFQGTLSLVSVAGHWRYDPTSSSITETVVAPGDPNCPA